MIDIEQVRQCVAKAIEDGETDVLLRVPAIDASGPIPRHAQASGSVSLHQDYADSPVGEAVHAIEVWARFRVSDVVAWIKRQEDAMSDIVTYDHAGVMVTIYKQRGQYGYRLRRAEDGRKLMSLSGFVSVGVAKSAAEARAAELAAQARGAA